jgi:hypothetical protein
MNELECRPGQDRAEPLIVDWPSDDRTDLEIAMRDGLVVASYDCDSFRVLEACRVRGGYEFAGVSRKEDVRQFSGADELHANFPVGAAKLAAGLEREASLDLALVTIGKHRTSAWRIARAELEGDCADATHFVSSAIVGAFAMRTGTRVPDLSPFAAHGTEETAQLPAVTGSGEEQGSGAAPEAAGGRRGANRRRKQSSEAASASAPAAHRRLNERRRPSTAVFAGIGVSAVLGAGLLTTQLLTDNGSRTGDGRALRHPPTGAPSPEDLPAASSSPSAREKPGHTKRPAPAPSRTGDPATPRAGRNGGGHTADPSRSRGANEHSSGWPDRPGKDGRGDGRPHPEWPDHPSKETLRPGDSGPEVAELQRRLKQVGYLEQSAEEDGVYSSRVRGAVFRYQSHYQLWDDAPGEYGPATRRHLEARTSG